MADLRLVGAVGIKVRPDTTGFRKDTQDKLDRELGRKGEKLNQDVKLDVDIDTTKAKAKVTKLQDEIKDKQVKLNVSVDYDGVQRARAQIDQALKSLDNKVLSFHMNPDSIKDANRQLKEIEKNAHVDFTFVRDEAGYQSILNKIKKIRAQKGLTSTWSFKTDTKSLREAEIKAASALRRINDNKTITLDYSKTFDGIQKAIGELDKRLATVRQIKTKLDPDSLKATKTKLLAELAVAPVTVKFNEDKEGYEKVLSRIKEIQREKIVSTLTFKTDDKSLEETANLMRDKIRSLEPRLSKDPLVFAAHLNKIDLDRIENEAKEVKSKIDNMKAAMQLGLTGHTPVAAELAFLGRDRVVTYFAKVNANSIAAAEGMLKSLGGIGILSGAGNIITSLFTKFDTMSLKAGALATVLGSLASAAVYAGTAMFTIGEGMLQSVGLLAAMPAMAVAAGSSLFVLTAAFDNFVGAFSSDAKKRAEALSELPPKAREVVESFRGLFDGLQRPVQDAFWESMDGSLQGLIDNTIPTLREGLLGLAPAMGSMLGGILNSFNKMAVAGDLATMFDNLEGFFVNLSKASEPFFDGFNAFGLKGSELLPRFGDWIAKLATRFDNWATTAAANGSIIQWIEQGVHSLQNMWQVGGSVIDMFQAITNAAGLAGVGGLAQFNINLRKTADAMTGEPWQSKARAIFDGARRGASGLNDGFKDLTRTLGNSSVWLGNVLDQLGRIGGESLSRLSDLLGGQTYQRGISAELEGMEVLVRNLGPAFKGLGDIVGNLGVVAGAVMRDMAPVINGIVDLLDSVTTTLSENLAKVAPKMLATVGGIFSAIAPVVKTVAELVNGVLDVLAQVPNSFVVAGVAAAAFFGMRAMASKFFESFSGTSRFKELESNWLGQQIAAGKTIDKYKLVNGELQKFTVPTERFSTTRAVFSDLTNNVGGTARAMRNMYDEARVAGGGIDRLSAVMTVASTTGMASLRAAAGGLVSALGGPWGLAIGAAAIGIGMFAQSQSDAKARVDALTQAIDKQTGQLNEQGLKEIAKEWTDLGKASDGWANLTRGAKAANETVQALGLSFQDVTKAVAYGGEAYDSLHDKLVGLEDAMKLRGDYGGFEEGTRRVQEFEQQLNLADGALKNVNKNDIKHLRENIEKSRAEAALAEAVFSGLGQATGTTTVAAEQMAQAMATIGDNSITAAQKIGAINRALDLLKGGTLSAREAEVQAQQSFQSAVQQAAAIREELANNANLINKTTGLIDVTSTSGLKLQQAMKTSADGIKIAAQAAYTEAKNAGLPASEASAKALQVIKDNQGELAKLAEAAGVSVDVLKNDWDSFFGKDWQLTAVFSANADKFQAAKVAVEEAGGAWSQKIFTALLEANPDPATWTIEDIKAKAVQFATDDYTAQLKAMNPQALESILQATGQADNYKNGNYTAVMKALNSTDPGVQAAWSALMGVVGGPSGAGWKAAVEAYATALAKAKADIDAVAAKRTAEIEVAVRAAVHGGPQVPLPMANGGILSPSLQPIRMQTFADGGFNGFQFEKPGPAKIYQGSNTWRVFAEKSTGSEAFIPMAASKRGRSTQILAEVANQFGYKLQKAVQFENGGITTGGNAKNTGLAVHIGTYNQNSQDTVDDVGRGIMRRVRSSQLTMEGF